MNGTKVDFLLRAAMEALIIAVSSSVAVVWVKPDRVVDFGADPDLEVEASGCTSSTEDMISPLFAATAPSLCTRMSDR